MLFLPPTGESSLVAEVDDIGLATATTMMLLTGAEDEPICKRVSSGGDLAFDASRLSFIEECTEEMEYEFTESRDSLTDLPSSHTYRKELPLKVYFISFIFYFITIFISTQICMIRTFLSHLEKRTKIKLSLNLALWVTKPVYYG